MPPTTIFIALADPTRCRIVEILRDGPQPVHTLAEAFTISRPAISRHLRILKEAHLIREKKVGRENIYRFNARPLKPVHAWLTTISVDPAPDVKKPSRDKKPAHTELAAISSKSIRNPAVSQMGFDF